MSQTTVSFKEARETINHLVQGVDPYSGEILDGVTFLEDPRMIRCFAVMSDVLTKCIEGENSVYKKEAFRIDENGADSIIMPEGEIGVMKLVNIINQTIDLDQMKRLSAFAFNRKLIEEGVLSYGDEDNSKKAVVNDLSSEHGIISIKTTFNGEVYDKVVYTDEGKDYVKSNLLKWFG